MDPLIESMYFAVAMLVYQRVDDLNEAIVAAIGEVSGGLKFF